MRMRKKKYLDERLDAVKSYILDTDREERDFEKAVEATNGFNGSDITNLLDKIEEISVIRSVITGEKVITANDVEKALEEIHSTVQADDIVKLKEWKGEND